MDLEVLLVKPWFPKLLVSAQFAAKLFFRHQHSLVTCFVEDQESFQAKDLWRQILPILCGKATSQA